MEFYPSLLPGLFLKRYKRFFADIETPEGVITAHVPNTGSLKSCSEAKSPCFYSQSSNPLRKLPFTLEMIQAPNGAWVGVNTANPNRLVREALDKKLFPWWQDFSEIHPEYKISKESRLDFALSKENSERRHFIEVKNVTLVAEKEIAGQQRRVAQFPDAVTERGQKHLKDLMRLMSEGHSAEILFTVQRNDAELFEPAEAIDPQYTQLLKLAIAQGVRVTAARVAVSPTRIELTSQLLTIAH